MRNPDKMSRRSCSFDLPARSEARQTDAISDLLKNHAHRQIHLQFRRSSIHDATQHARPLLQLHNRNVIGRVIDKLRRFILLNDGVGVNHTVAKTHYYANITPS